MAKTPSSGCCAACAGLLLALKDDLVDLAAQRIDERLAPPLMRG
jgi:hypothetical protein